MSPPATTANAVTVDFDRAAKRHIAFARGFHRCLGSHLARMELSVILGALHERIPDDALDPDREPGYNNTMIRTVDPLPLVFAPGPDQRDSTASRNGSSTAR